MPHKEDPASLPEPNWQPIRKPTRLKPLIESKVPLITQQPPVVQPPGLHPPFVHPTAATPQMENLTEIGNSELPNLAQNNVKNTLITPAMLLLISALAMLILTVSITTWPSSPNFIKVVRVFIIFSKATYIDFISWIISISSVFALKTKYRCLNITGCCTLNHQICPILILLLGLNSIILLINENTISITPPFIIITNFIFIFRTKAQIYSILANQFPLKSVMGIFNNILTMSLCICIFKCFLINFIHYVINIFYHVLFINIYELSLSKFYISDITMTGITSTTHGLSNPFLHILNFSTNYFIEDNDLSPTITYFWVLVLVLVFSLFMYFNFKIYSIKVSL